MEKSNNQIEKNVSASFSYVKKDMLMLNDAFSDLHDKVQHLSLNHAMLLEQITKLKAQISNKKPVIGKETLEFYDVKSKSKFKTDKYRIVNKSGRKFAVAIGPQGTDSYRILGVSKTARKRAPVKKKVVKAKPKTVTKKTAAKKKAPVKKKVVKETITYS